MISKRNFMPIYKILKSTKPIPKTIQNRCQKICPKIMPKLFLRILPKTYSGYICQKILKNYFMPQNKSKIFVEKYAKIRLHSIQLIPKKSNFYIKDLFQRTLGILNPEIIMVFGISG